MKANRFRRFIFLLACELKDWKYTPYIPYWHYFKYAAKFCWRRSRHMEAYMAEKRRRKEFPLQ